MTPETTVSRGNAVYDVILYIVCLGIASFILLVAGEILSPFFSLMRPGIMKTFLLILFPYGIAALILFVSSTVLIARMQKYD